MGLVFDVRLGTYFTDLLVAGFGDLAEMFHNMAQVIPQVSVETEVKNLVIFMNNGVGERELSGRIVHVRERSGALRLGFVAGGFLYDGVEDFVGEGVIEVMTPDFMVGIKAATVGKVGFPIFIFEEGLEFFLVGVEWFPRALVGRWDIVLDDGRNVIFNHYGICGHIVNVFDVGFEGRQWAST